MENFRADKMDTLCRKNFHTNGNVNSFEYIPEYLKQYLTKLTFIEQNPVFTFPNKFEVSLLGKYYEEKYSWEVFISLGDFKFDSFPDFLSCNFNPLCKSFADLLAGLYFVPSTDTEAWIKTLQNSRRKTWKISEDVITSDKFKKVYEKALSIGIEENLKTMPFIKPYLKEEISNISEKDTSYIIKYNFGVEVSSQKWNKGYQIKINNNPKILIMDSIMDVNKMIKEYYENYLQDKKSQQIAENTHAETLKENAEIPEKELQEVSLSEENIEIKDKSPNNLNKDISLNNKNKSINIKSKSEINLEISNPKTIVRKKISKDVPQKSEDKISKLDKKEIESKRNNKTSSEKRKNTKKKKKEEPET